MSDLNDLWEAMNDPSRRSEVVQVYKSLGLGGERYGVSCPKCYKRICLQGLWLAKENPDKFCLCEDNYLGSYPSEDIFGVLQEHGIPTERAWDLQVRPDMTEGGKVKKKKENPNLGTCRECGRRIRKNSKGKLVEHYADPNGKKFFHCEGTGTEPKGRGPTIGDMLGGLHA